MSNVEYRCPECSGRAFLPPGGTRLKCRHHTESVYRQVEVYDGPDFSYVDEEGKSKTHDIVGPTNERVRSEPTKSGITLDAIPPADELRVLRDTYQLITGGEADKRWRVERIKDELYSLTHPDDEVTGVSRSDGEQEPTQAEDEAEDDEEGYELITVPKPGSGEIVEEIPEETNERQDNGH